MSDNTTVKKILILVANPKETSPLRLDEEVRNIQEAIRLAKKRDRFIVEQRWAVRPKDVQQAMLDVEPQIVHFSGHGVADKELVLEDLTGNPKLVDAQALAELFRLFKEKLECVILNACYSEVQAEAIVQHVSCVIGTNQAIGDKAAITFAEGFYRAIGAGSSVERAYEFGRNAIQLEGFSEETTLVIKKNPNLSSSSKPSLNKVGLTDGQRRRAEEKLKTLEKDWNLRNNKIRRLRTALAIEVSEAIKFQLEEQIENEKSHLGHLEEDIFKIEHELQ
ncbi:CHAT domain-containing protein [Scytonema sp. UIC 10036]|uniref:CHAT domain-containing protein n=1 Tax=Scytonema sp. UIC 10036 TaxID=2304196 RepID=UPI0012DA4BF0|nr:CHAT domain-containing protein [Scytonema sp. UIC 10036]MUG94111.1 CHAT domain-containing protein [Scytonema sp. UIC 10036]